MSTIETIPKDIFFMIVCYLVYNIIFINILGLSHCLTTAEDISEHEQTWEFNGIQCILAHCLHDEAALQESRIQDRQGWLEKVDRQKGLRALKKISWVLELGAWAIIRFWIEFN